MTDIEADIRPVVELFRTLRSEGVRADNRDRLRRTVANLRVTEKELRASYDFPKLVNLEQLEKTPAKLKFQSELIQEVWEQLCLATREKKPGMTTREEQELLEQSISSTRTVLAFQIALEHQLPVQDTPQTEPAPQVLRARPAKGRVDWAQLSREHIARYPKIRARLAE